MDEGERGDRWGEADWDAFVAGHRYGHFLQGAGWARLRARYGWRCERVAVGPTGAPTAGAQVLVRHTRLGAFGYVPRGPLCGPADEAWPELVRALRVRCRSTCVAVRIEPDWPDDGAWRRGLVDTGWVEAEATQPRSTIRVPLEATDEALLAAMKHKWRYNIRVARRHGVAAEVGGEDDLGTFEDLMDGTAVRDGFPRREAGYYAAVYRALGPAARLYVARLASEVLAAILVVHYGPRATYLYGASSDRERRAMPNHALQWQAMRSARDQGCREYDLWGIPDEVGAAVAAGGRAEEVPLGRGGLWGVWGFKRGFGGRVSMAIGAFDDVYRPARYRLGRRAGPVLRRWLGAIRR